MRCKYVLINGLLIKDIANGKYTNITFEKISHNRYFVKSDEKNLGVFDKKEIRFMKELLWQLSFVKGAKQ